MEMMVGLLRAGGHKAVAASDAEAGLDLVRADRPDVVVCDIQLPGMDGFELLRRIKADAETSSIPVIAVTAFAMADGREQALAAGFDGFIGKPIVPEIFLSQLEEILRSLADRS